LYTNIADVFVNRIDIPPKLFVVGTGWRFEYIILSLRILENNIHKLSCKRVMKSQITIFIGILFLFIFSISISFPIDKVSSKSDALTDSDTVS